LIISVLKSIKLIFQKKLFVLPKLILFDFLERKKAIYLQLEKFKGKQLILNKIL
jgi:hypothetical protein